jgi:hypothetical protein
MKILLLLLFVLFGPSLFATTIDSFQVDENVLTTGENAALDIPEGNASVSYRVVTPIQSEYITESSHSIILTTEIDILEDSMVRYDRNTDIHFLPVKISINFSASEQLDFKSYKKLENLDIPALMLIFKKAGLEISGLGYQYFQNEMNLYEMHSVKLLELQFQKAFKISRDGKNQIIFTGMAAFNYGSTKDKFHEISQIIENDDADSSYRVRTGASVNVKLTHGFLLSYYIGTDHLVEFSNRHYYTNLLFNSIEGVTLRKNIDRNGNFNFFISANWQKYKLKSLWDEEDRKSQFINVQTGLEGRW